MNVRQNGQMSDGKRHFKTSVRCQALIRPNKGRKKIWLFLMTALIVYKILTVYKEIRGSHNSNIQAGAIENLNASGRRDLNPLVSILIESGLITFVGQLAQCLMFRLASESLFPLISGVVVMLYVRASCRLQIWCFNNYLLHREFRW